MAEDAAGLQALVDDLRIKLSAALPQGWEQKFDDSTGTSYFENASTGESSWDVPPQPPPSSSGAGDVDVGALQKELKKLQKADKKREAELKGVALKETAMKTDINKMKSETRQAKKEAADAKTEANRQVALAQEALARAEMQAEDDMMRVVSEHSVMIGGIVKSIRARDMEAAHEAMGKFRLLEQIDTAPEVTLAVSSAIDEYNAHVTLVASLEATIEDLQSQLAFEKSERQRENEEWRALVAERDQEITDLKARVAELEARVAELELYIAEAEARHAEELARARQLDTNRIAALEAELAYALERHEDYMSEIASMWRKDIPPPSLLRKYVIPFRNGEKADRQLVEHDRIRVGSHVQAWDDASADYLAATVTAMKIDDRTVEVRWKAGSEEPPVWVSLDHCFAVVPEDMYRQVEIATQTDVAMYDTEIVTEDPFWGLGGMRPRSARGRMDGGLEESDRAAALALREKARREVAERSEQAVASIAVRLFKLIDVENAGELSLESVWNAIVGKKDVRALLDVSPALQPIMRKEYLVLAWKHVDVDDDITMPFPDDDFVQVCSFALELSRRDAQERLESPIDAVQTLRDEFSRATKANESSSEGSSVAGSSIASESSFHDANSDVESEAASARSENQEPVVLSSPSSAKSSADELETGSQPLPNPLSGSQEGNQVGDQGLQIDEDGNIDSVSTGEDYDENIQAEDEEDERDYEEDEEVEKDEEDDESEDEDGALGISRRALVSPWLTDDQIDLETQLSQLIEEQKALTEELASQRKTENENVQNKVKSTTEALENCLDEIAELEAKRATLRNSAIETASEAHKSAAHLESLAGKLTKLPPSVPSSYDGSVSNQASTLASQAVDSTEADKSQNMEDTNMKESEGKQDNNSDKDNLGTSSSDDTLLHPGNEAFQVDSQSSEAAIQVVGISGSPERSGCSDSNKPVSTISEPFQEQNPECDWTQLQNALACQLDAVEVLVNKRRVSSEDATLKKATLETALKEAKEKLAFVAAQVKAQQGSTNPKQAEETERALAELASEKASLDAEASGLVDQIAALEATIRDNDLASKALEDVGAQLSEGHEHLTTLELTFCDAVDELEASRPLLVSLREQEQVLHEAKVHHITELETLQAHAHEQDFVLQSIAGLTTKLSTEKRHNDDALLRLVEHKELLNARMADAKLQLENTANDLEKAIATERFEFAEIEVPKGLEWAQAKWDVETELRKKITANQCSNGNESCARLRAALSAVTERQTLRSLIEAEVNDTLTDAKALATNDGAPATDRDEMRGRQRRRAAALFELRKLSKTRETAWSHEAFEKARGDTTSWIAQQERDRLETRIEIADRDRAEAVAYYNATSRRLESTLENLQDQNVALTEKLANQRSAFNHELEALAEASDRAASLLHTQLDDEKALNRELIRCSRERLEMTENDLESTKRELNGRIAYLNQTLVQNRYWIDTLKEDLRDLHNEHSNLKKLRERELIVCATQRDQLLQELEAMTQHGARLDNWVNSLKGEVQLLNDSLDAKRLEAERTAMEHRREAQWLRWETWKRDETARTIGTNVDACFAYFAECLARLAGASQEFNERIGANAGVQVLLALLDSSRTEVRRNALTALANSAWNGHVDYRTLSHRTMSDWKRWNTGVATVTTLRWYKERNAAARRAETHLDGRGGEEDQGLNFTSFASFSTPCPLAEPGMTVVIHQNQVKVVPLSVAEGTCGANLPNQERIGKGLHGKATGTEMMMSILSFPDVHEVEQAASTLAVLSLKPENRERIVQVSGALDTLLSLCDKDLSGSPLTEEHEAEEQEVKGDDDDDSNEASNGRETAKIKAAEQAAEIGLVKATPVEMEDIQLHALSIIANIMFECEENQIKFAKAEGIARMINLLRTSQDVDVLERCTGALVNATTLYAANCEAIGSAGGLEVLVDLCSSDLGQEALDKAGSRIQANAAEILVNATREHSSKSAVTIAEFGLSGLVQMCFSHVVPVQQAAACVLGNIAQDDKIRAALGEEGGVEALFTLCESEVELVRSNALWAMSSLAWNARNQDTIGRQLPQLVRLCQDSRAGVREHATAVLANCMFYHEGNRRRFGLFTKAIRAIVGLLADETQPHKVYENAARALGTAAYNDAVAMQAGVLGAVTHLVRLAATCPSGGAQRTAAFALGNLAVHDVLKTLIVAAGGVEAMTGLCGGSDCPETRRLAEKVLKVLADMSRADQLAERRKKYGVMGMVQLVQGERETAEVGSQANMQALACEELNAVASESPERVREVCQCRGHAVLAQVAASTVALPRKLEDPFERKLAQRALWAMQTLATGGGDRTEIYQDALGTVGAVRSVLSILDSHYTRAKSQGLATDGVVISNPTETTSVNVVSSRDVCEAALGTLFALCKEHGPNCRRIISDGGISMLVQIAEDNTLPASESANSTIRQPPGSTRSLRSQSSSNSKLKPTPKSGRTANSTRSNSNAQANIQERDPTLGHLVLELMQIMGPHSWLQCRNCKSKETCGTTCSQCGHTLIANLQDEERESKQSDDKEHVEEEKEEGYPTLRPETSDIVST